MSKDVKSSGNGGGFRKLQGCGESSEEELSALPCDTKVVVTGNNRTKSTLVGLQGVVKKAVGLGGWHWLELEDGVEVKLQRNALTVIEAPHTREKDGDLDNKDSKGKKSDTSFQSQRSLHQSIKSSGSHTKTMKKSASNNSKTKDSVSAPHGSSIDLSKLDTVTLKKYLRHYNLEESNSKSNPSREQLLDVVEKHFVSQEVDESEVIAGFVQAVKRERKASK